MSKAAKQSPEIRGAAFTAELKQIDLLSPSKERNGTGDMVNANRDNQIARLVKAASRDAQLLT